MLHEIQNFENIILTSKAISAGRTGKMYSLGNKA